MGVNRKTVSNSDHTILRDLAEAVAEIASLPDQGRKRHMTKMTRGLGYPQADASA